MKGVSTCEVCKKEFKWRRSKNQKTPRCCSLSCVYKIRYQWANKERFQWDLATEEEKLRYALKSFEERVIRKDGCWDWKGVIHPDGYTRIGFFKKNKVRPGHVVSWILFKGEIPKGLCVCHKCDNRKCTNPDHLFLATSQENTQDKVNKNRQCKGSKNGQSKLTEDCVMEIKKLIKSGVTCTRIGLDYNVSTTIISKIKNGQYWKHVEG